MKALTIRSFISIRTRSSVYYYRWQPGAGGRTVSLAQPPHRGSELRNGNLIDDLDTETFERDDLAGMVGQQADPVEPKVRKDLRSDAVFVLQLTLSVHPLIMQELAAMGT